VNEAEERDALGMMGVYDLRMRDNAERERKRERDSIWGYSD